MFISRWMAKIQRTPIKTIMFVYTDGFFHKIWHKFEYTASSECAKIYRISISNMTPPRKCKYCLHTGYSGGWGHTSIYSWIHYSVLNSVTILLNEVQEPIKGKFSISITFSDNAHAKSFLKEESNSDVFSITWIWFSNSGGSDNVPILFYFKRLPSFFLYKQYQGELPFLSLFGE